MQYVRQITGIRNWKLPEEYEVEFPPGEQRKLKIMERQPRTFSHGVRMRRQMKRLIDLRGPELVHNSLLHKQYGIKAFSPGYLKWGHIEGMRLYLNRNIDERRMFAIWRIDSPWKPITKKSKGTRMGGGKGLIDHFVTPVKKDRIIFEVGGFCEFKELEPLLSRIAAKLPFEAKAITHEMLEEEERIEKDIIERNINPFNFEYCLKNNFLGSRKWASTYDYMWHNKYR